MYAFTPNRRLRSRLIGLTLLVLLGLHAGAEGAGPSTQFVIDGDVTNPATYTLAGLQALPATTLPVEFVAGTSTQQHTYTGVDLWTLVNGAGIVTNPRVKNDILRKYVVATGSDGYRAVFAAGEFNPDFGARPYFVAYRETINNQSVLLGSDGFARIAVPGDYKGGRYVSNLISLDVLGAASTAAGTGGGVSDHFTVSGTVQQPGASFDLGALQAFAPAGQITQEVTFIAGGQSETHTYSGVSLWDLLTQVGIVTRPGVKNDILGKYLVATGSDGYKTVVSMGEIDPDFGRQRDFVAFSEIVNGQAQPLGSNGFARMVVPGDVRGGRYVSNLVSLEVLNAAPLPEPGSALLMLTGVAGVILLRARRSALGAQIVV
jgi:DMSO/TMAO reductase YedYZ molybdopterin-dependent catalytic subunit